MRLLLTSRNKRWQNRCQKWWRMSAGPRDWFYQDSSRCETRKQHIKQRAGKPRNSPVGKRGEKKKPLLLGLWENVPDVFQIPTSRCIADWAFSSAVFIWRRSGRLWRRTVPSSPASRSEQPKTGRPGFIELLFIALHRCSFFTKWKQDLPPAKNHATLNGHTHVITVVWNQTWNISCTSFFNSLRLAKVAFPPTKY